MTPASPSQQLNAAVIGCGRIGGGDAGVDGTEILGHAAAYDRHEGFRLTACVEPDEVRRRAFMTRWKVARGFATIEEALADGVDWDVVSVCTPTPRHAADLRALLATSTLAVWCEKPLTGSAADSAEIVAAYAAAGKPLAVNHLRRWHPAMARLKAEIEAGEWGAVRAVAGYYTKGVRNNGSHLIDLIQYLIGPVGAASPAVARVDHDPDDPTIDAVLRTEDGTPVHLVGGDARDYALFELEIIAAGGSIRIERSGRAIRLRRPVDDPLAPGYRMLGDGDIIEVGSGDAFLRAADNLYRAVVDGAPLACDGATALATERICDALIARAGAWQQETL